MSIFDIFKKGKEKVADIWDDVTDWVGDKTDDVGDFFKNSASQVSSAVKNLFDGNSTLGQPTLPLNPNNKNTKIGGQSNFLGESSLIGGQLGEWFTGQNPYSAEGQQRVENEKARSFSQIEAEKQRAWEEQMSNTSFQRGMADMKMAGLNPILAHQQGGASTPQGSSASGSGTNQTAKTDPIGSMARMAALFTGMITTGARLGAMSNNSMAKIVSNEKIASLKNASAWQIANQRNASAMERATLRRDKFIFDKNGQLVTSMRDWKSKH